MGRIAEALKRAERERSQRLGEEVPAPMPEPMDVQPPDVQSGTDAAASLSFLDTPPPPKPFPANAEPILPECVDPRVVALHDPTSAIAEKYRSVRTRLLTANPGCSPRVLAITSSMPKEGKTVTVANLGFSLGELRYLRVAMVDLDFRRRGLSRHFQVDDKPGIAEVLRGEKRLGDICLPAVRNNLYFLPTGNPADASPTDLLANLATQGIFRELTSRFHYTLIDTPPVDTAADIGLIAPLCHSVIMVARLHKTPESALCRSVKTLQANQVAVAGCILVGPNESSTGFDSHDYLQSVI